MSTVITTKIHVPLPRSAHLERPALIDTLRGGAGGRLTLVTAPAGWGKTTLLSGWHAADGEVRRFAWVSLDAGDNDPVRFWSHVVAAVRSVEPAVGVRSATALAAPGVDVCDAVLSPLLNDLAALPGDRVLVIDDYHLIDNAAVHADVRFLVDHAPRTLQLAIATRADPSVLGLARLRARGELTEIRAARLGFTAEEAAALLAAASGTELATEDVAVLRDRTEGWAAGLYLAGLSLRDHPDPRRFVTGFAGDDGLIVDYLTDEVLATRSADEREFLLRTAVLERLCGPLCDAVTGRSGSSATLAELARSNLFLVPLDSTRRWYRYHHLFADVLRQELRRTAPELVAQLHRRAGAWFAGAGRAAEAIRHAIAAGDATAASDLMAREWQAVANSGQVHTVLGWLDALPDGGRADPRLCVAAAWCCRLLGRLDDVECWLGAAEQAAPGGGAGPVDGSVAMLRALHRVTTGAVDQALPAARRAVELESTPQSPGRATACLVLGLALYWHGDPGAARSHLEYAAPRIESGGHHFRAMLARGYLAAIDLDEGDLRGAERAAREALAFAESRALGEFPTAAMAHLVLGRAIAERGGGPDAARHLERGITLGRRGHDRLHVGYGLLALARAVHAHEPERARTLLAACRRLVAGCRDPGRLATLLAAAGQPAAAPGSALTEREVAVLRLLGGTLSQPQIASALFLSPNTVKTHIRSVYRKLGVSGRAAAVRLARDRGLI